MTATDTGDGLLTNYMPVGDPQVPVTARITLWVLTAPR